MILISDIFQIVKMSESEGNKEKPELRPMFCEVGPVTRADGSCMLSSGDTTGMYHEYL